MKKILLIFSFLISTIGLFGQISNADGSYRVCYGDGPPTGGTTPEKYACRQYLDTTNMVLYVLNNLTDTYVDESTIVGGGGGAQDSLALNTSPGTISSTQATMHWDADEETVSLVQNGAVLQVGQELHWHVRNNTGVQINNGILVMATGTIGASGRITIAPYDGTTDARYILGVTTEDIPDGDDGKVTAFGKVRNLNTTAWNEGDVLYADTGGSGALTSTEPVTGINVPVAFVITDHATNGTLAVRITPIDLNSIGGASLWEEGVTSDTINPITATNIALPSLGKIYLDGGLDTYIHESAANTISFTANSSARAVLNTSEFDFNVFASFQDGNAAGPGIRFDSDLDVGFFKAGTDAIGITAGGVEAMRFTETAGLIDNTMYGTLSMATNGIGYDASNPGIFFGTDGNLALGEDASQTDAHGFVKVTIPANGSTLANSNSFPIALKNTDTTPGTSNYMGYTIGGVTQSNPRVFFGESYFTGAGSADGKAVIAVRDGFDLLERLTIDGSGATDIIGDLQVSGDQTLYGEMYFNKNTTAQTPVANDTMAIQQWTTGSLLNGFTFTSGSKETYTVATGDKTGHVGLYVGGTTLVAGDWVMVTNTTGTDYSGVHEVASVSADTVYYVGTFTATGTGNIDEPDRLTLSATGYTDATFNVNWRIGGSVAGTPAGDDVSWGCYVNEVPQVNTFMRRTLSSGSVYGSFSGGGLVQMSTGDDLFMFFISDDVNAITHNIGSLTIEKK